MANSYLGRCEQDLVGFNFLNSGYPLRIGTATTVANALVIDTNASPGYTGTVQLSISDELGMTAVFQETGTTFLTKTVGPNTLTWIPLIVTATDCGYDRGYYWEFRVWYTSSPDYSANTGGEDPDPCGKPLRSVKVCRWDARWDNKCLARFATDLTEVTGTGVATLPFLLNQSPQCTGAVTVVFNTECDGLTFGEGEGSNITYTRSNGNKTLTVVCAEGYEGTEFDVSVNYDTADINCYCSITAETTYENSLPNSNLLTFGNNGTFSGFTTQAQFNTAGVLARSSTTFGFTTGISGTALRTQITTPPDYTNRPVPGTPVNPSASDGSIIWQGDITAPVALINTTRYWLRGKVRIDSGTPLIRANEEVHIDKFNVGGSAPTQNVALPYISQYTPQGQYLDCGIRFLSGSGSTITPYVRYVNTLATGSFTTLMGDLYLGDSAFSDWCNIELTRYYPSDAISCPERTHLFKNSSCEYNTYLGLEEGTPCESIDFVDNSDFGYEPGHDRSDFTVFRKITAMGPDGASTILSSVTPRNIIIPSASGDTNPPLIYAGYDISQGGFYEFTLCNVPTFRNDIAYPLGTNVVFYDGVGNLVFLECISSVAGYIPFLTTGWEWVWKTVTEAELNEKYCDTQYYIQLCGLVKCISEYQNKLICSLDYICSQSLCENECLMNYFELMMIKQVSDYTKPGTVEKCWGTQEYRDILNYVNQLCQTCECK